MTHLCKTSRKSENSKNQFQDIVRKVDWHFFIWYITKNFNFNIFVFYKKHKSLKKRSFWKVLLIWLTTVQWFRAYFKETLELHKEEKILTRKKVSSGKYSDDLFYYQNFWQPCFLSHPLNFRIFARPQRPFCYKCNCTYT